ncbi:NrtR DNA-binding winged helix domain-containing protein [Rhodococcus gannanensis]|uniref:NUDIX hydrolase n=1 Tax=Rhodococcus gannanensis TaxID=1960308 RepID=A0ABW4NY39_9NOCA
MPLHPDSNGKTFADYDRPSVAVDVAVLTYVDGAIKVLVVEHEKLGGRALPGTFLHSGERLADAAARALRDKARLSGTSFRQLAMFDDPDRDDRGWVISMAHTAAIPDQDLPGDAVLVPVTDGRCTGDLLFDHADMVALAVRDLRDRYTEQVDPDGLLGEQFTMLQLNELYRVVFALERLQKDSFRRHVIGALEPTGAWSAEGAGRPAELFRRADDASLSVKAAALFAK